MIDELQPLAALHGPQGLGQVLAMQQGDHPLYGPALAQFRQSPGVRPMSAGSGLTRALIDGEPPTATAARASTLNDVDVFWNTSRPGLLDIKPEPGIAEAAIAARLARQASEIGVARMEGFVSGIVGRITEAVTWHQQGSRRYSGEDSAAMSGQIAAFELNRWETAIEKGLVKQDDAVAAWAKLKDGGNLEPEEAEILASSMVSFSKATSWLPHPELEFEHNPLAELRKVDLETGVVEVDYHNKPKSEAGIASLMSNKIVDVYRKTVDDTAMNLWRQQGQPSVEFDTPQHARAFKLASAMLGEVVGLKRRFTPGELAGLFTLLEEVDVDDFMEDLPLALAGDERVDADTVTPTTGDLGSWGSPVEEGDFVRIRSDAAGEVRVLFPNRGATPDRLRGRWDTGFTDDGLAIWGHVKPEPVHDVEQVLTRVNRGEMFTQDPGVWATPGLHAVALVESDRAVSQLRSNMEAAGKFQMRYLGGVVANRDGERGRRVAVAFTFDDAEGLSRAAQILEDAKIYVDDASQAPEGYSRASETYVTDSYGRTVTYVQAGDTAGPYKTPVYVRQAPEQGLVEQAPVRGLEPGQTLNDGPVWLTFGERGPEVTPATADGPIPPGDRILVSKNGIRVNTTEGSVADAERAAEAAWWAHTVLGAKLNIGSIS